jgi:hypothetical protein
MIVQITPRPGRMVLHPVTRRTLVGPEVVEYSAYWQRRVADGDVDVAEIPEEIPSVHKTKTPKKD